jgi:ferric-dicitrate binding protein FerR (iron transport regulator)
MTKENNYYERLITKYLDGQASEDDTRELLEWIEENEKNREYFFQIRAIWQDTGALAIYFDPDKEWKKLHRRINKVRRLNRNGFWFRIAQFAALFFIAFLVGWFVKNQYIEKPEKSWLKVKVPTGQVTQLTLADSSKVWLNSESTFRYPSDFSKDRKVFLSGEAYFEVENNKELPFTVKTDYIDVQVLGTRFNIRAYQKDCEFLATILEGKVALMDGKSGDTRSTLYRGDQAQFKRRNNELNVHKLNDNPESSIDWIKGRYEFHDQPLSQVLNFASRWYDVKFVVKDKELKETRFTGVMKREYPPEQLLDLISRTEEINIQKVRDKIIISSEQYEY